MTEDELLTLARDAAGLAHAPYSGYRVGAALLTGDDEVQTAANVENASYGLTICAERVALTAARSRGWTDMRTLAVYAEGQALPYPCGACLQVAWELAPRLRFVLASAGHAALAIGLDELLPRPFVLEERT